ncbi:uncharacterized protein [Periplaneta americana]|uniref:uncharacterized protein n=1 Tax=Periplaneta americana TaxID=6978 RepID=UPI0037E97957
MTLPSLEAARRSQRPYRYGMILLCVGALINWLGLAENYVEPVRYIGVACIIAGALLICAAMCCWLQRPTPDHPDNVSQVSELDHQIHVIEIPCSLEPSVVQQKPPDYDSVADMPPCYEDAIKLSPSLLLSCTTEASAPSTSSAADSGSRQAISRLQEVTLDRYGVPTTPPPPYAPTR